MVAASKLRKAQTAADSSKPYAAKIKEVINNVAQCGNGVNHPMLETREIKRTGYLVITSDRGLAGGYNSNLLRKLVQILDEKHQSKEEYTVFVIGRKGRDFLKKRGIPILDEVIGLSDSPEFADIKFIASAAVDNFAKGNYDELVIVYNEFINAVTQIPTDKQILPLSNTTLEKTSSPSASYEYEPSAEGVLEVLLPKYAETLIYSAVLNAKASEFGARMTAMGNATKNATEIIGDLELQYNRARQAAITQEITEIVAGANATS